MSNQIKLIEVEEVEVFKPVISVTELWMKTLENVTKDFGARVTQALAEKYGFALEEAVAFLGLESVAVNRKAMAKCAKASKEPKEKKEKKDKEEKVRLPFTGACDATKCLGISYNHGLFTQCTKSPLENHTYCKNCQAQAYQNASGKPDCGTIDDRLASPMYGYTDSKGRNPVPYAKIMAKYNYTREQVEAEFAKLNGDAVLNPVFFEEAPKKTAEAVASENCAENTTEKKKSGKLTDEEKAAKKAIKDAKDKEEKDKRAADRDVKLAEAKAKREAEKEAEKAKREAEKEQEKAKREAEKEQEKAKRKAEKEQEKAKKAQEKKEKGEMAKADKEAKESRKEGQ